MVNITAANLLTWVDNTVSHVGNYPDCFKVIFVNNSETKIRPRPNERKPFKKIDLTADDPIIVAVNNRLGNTEKGLKTQIQKYFLRNFDRKQERL